VNKRILHDKELDPAVKVSELSSSEIATMPWKDEHSSVPKERFFTTYQKPAMRFKKKRRTNKHKEKLPKSSRQRTSKKQHDAEVPTIRDMPSCFYNVSYHGHDSDP
jgi:hypothetical protein